MTSGSLPLNKSVRVALDRSCLWTCPPQRIGRLSFACTWPGVDEIQKSSISKRWPANQKGFSGAEIEVAVKGGILDAYIDGCRSVRTLDLRKRTGSIRPTS